MLPVSFAWRAAGTAPATVDRSWCKEAARRIVAAYHERGYQAARAWVLAARDEGRVVLRVDEGRISLMQVLGASTYEALQLQIDLRLPHDVFHRPTLDRAVAELRTKYGFSSARYKLITSDKLAYLVGTRSVPGRLLRVYVVRTESVGWDIGLRVAPLWGTVPRVSLAVPNLLEDEDRFEVEGGIAVPLRRYLTEESPKFRWIHGYVDLGYRFSWFARRLAPEIRVQSAVSRYQRLDRNLLRYHSWRIGATLGAELRLAPMLTLSGGPAVQHIQTFDLVRVDPERVAPATGSVTRGGARLALEMEFDTAPPRRDLRSHARLSIAGGASPEQWIVRANAFGQWTLDFGELDFVVQVHGTLMEGQVRYWDEKPLGDYLRVFFGNRYWIHRVGVVSGALRYGLWGERFKVGIFHQAAVFGDRTVTPVGVALANAFGPAVHIVLWDVFAINIYYGFGFAPAGFDHNFSLQAQTIF